MVPASPPSRPQVSSPSSPLGDAVGELPRHRHREKSPSIRTSPCASPTSSLSAVMPSTSPAASLSRAGNQKSSPAASQASSPEGPLHATSRPSSPVESSARASAHTTKEQEEDVSGELRGPVSIVAKVLFEKSPALFEEWCGWLTAWSQTKQPLEVRNGILVCTSSVALRLKGTSTPTGWWHLEEDVVRRAITFARAKWASELKAVAVKRWLAKDERQVGLAAQTTVGRARNASRYSKQGHAKTTEIPTLHDASAQESFAAQDILAMREKLPHKTLPAPSRGILKRTASYEPTASDVWFTGGKTRVRFRCDLVRAGSEPICEAVEIISFKDLGEEGWYNNPGKQAECDDCGRRVIPPQEGMLHGGKAGVSFTRCLFSCKQCMAKRRRGAAARGASRLQVGSPT